jgi:hypothetical protein
LRRRGHRALQHISAVGNVGAGTTGAEEKSVTSTDRGKKKISARRLRRKSFHATKIRAGKSRRQANDRSGSRSKTGLVSKRKNVMENDSAAEVKLDGENQNTDSEQP